MIPQEWTAKHPQALADLLSMVGATTPAGVPGDSRTTEAFAQSVVRLEAPRYGVWLTRNNVGVLKDVTGRPVRYGLANESPAQNRVIKSGDLIGWRSVMITREHVGQCMAQFVSRECKRPGWRWSGDEHETAQLAWAALVNAAGGDARFATGEGSFI
jgi:hypothetical protein